LKQKVQKNKNETPFVKLKKIFEGNSAKIIPMTQGKDIIYFVMGGLSKASREGST
jgi:hypothetical protein